jgi:hypothetical protein
MSLKLAAQHLASKGRGPDTTLVHMAPQEVAGLQALARAHGGTLTTNPDTGLPEAGFLRAILPMVAGAALGPAGLGLTAMQAGLATAALGTVATGSLKQGLMAGLGAYGGAGLMGSVVGAGNAAASGLAAGEAAGAGAAEAAAQMTPAAGGVVPVAAPPVTPVAMPSVIDPTSADFGGAMFTGPAPAAPAVPAASVIDPVTRMNMQVAPGVPTVTTSPYIAEPGTVLAPRTVPYEQMKAAGLGDEAIRQSATEYGANMKGFAQNPFSQATQQAMASPVSTGIKAIADKPSLLFNKENLKYGAAALAPVMFQEPEKRAEYQGGGSNPYQYEYDPGRQAYTPSAGSSEQAYFRPRYNLMADGGLAALSGGGASHLGDYSDGGRLLRGPGDGVSDDIPATIANKRPARLADGEFVVPARIVSELGNGSTEAGARKLYAMMDRVQKNRSKTVGKNKVAVDSRSEKLLPA